MKSSVLFTLAGTVCCLAGLASAQVSPTSAAARGKSLGQQPGTQVSAPAKATNTEGVSFVDNCGDAPTVAEGTYAFDTSDATNDYAGTCGATGTAGDKWVRYVASDTGIASVSTCNLSGSDTVLAVINGCGGATIVCLDDSCGLQSTVQFNATAGSAYLVRVAGFAGGAASGSVSITNAGGGGGGGPENDNCADATTVTDGTYDFDNTTATTDATVTCGFNTGGDLWYKYTPATDGQVVASTCGLVGFDTVLAGFDGCGGNQIACLDDYCGLQTELRISATAGNPVWIRLAGYNDQRGAGQIAFSFIQPCHPVQPGGAVLETEDCGNDDNGGCNNGGGLVQTINVGDTVWGTAWASGGTRDTDWYELNAAEASNVTVTATAAFPIRLFVLDANCPPAIVATNASTGDCTEVSVSGIVGAGLFRVFAGTNDFDGFPCGGGVDNHYSMTVTAETIDAPDNDLCADATVVTDGTYDFDNSLAGNDGAASCGGSNDVWYSYTAASDGLLNVTTCGLSGMDTELAAFDGCGGAEMACNDDACGLQSNINVPVNANQTVLVRVSGFGGGRGSGQVAFTLGEPCVLTQPSGSTLENEDCQSDTATDRNGGCNDPELEVQTVGYNTAIWGTASTFIDPATGGQYRDTDWYEVEFAGGTFEISGVAGFNLRLFILDTVCPGVTILATTASTGPCQEVSLSLDLPAGTYRVFAGLDGFTGLDCGGATDNHYILNIGQPSSCPADFNGDGFLDFFDYDDYVGCFETGICPPGRTADFNGDGFADFFDYDDYVGAFETGC